MRSHLFGKLLVYEFYSVFRDQVGLKEKVKAAQSPLAGKIDMYKRRISEDPENPENNRVRSSGDKSPKREKSPKGDKSPTSRKSSDNSIHSAFKGMLLPTV